MKEKAGQREETILVIDDDPAVRQALLVLLQSVGFRHRGFGSGPEFLAQFDPAQPGCIVSDVRMPGMSGLELQRELNSRGALAPLILVSGHGDVPMVVQAMKDGAVDFVEKPFRDQDLLDRVNRAIRADRETRRMLGAKHELRRRVGTLTPRERQVMEVIAEGKSNKVVAMDLGMSGRTVEIHRARVMEKMGARSFAQLVRMSVELGARETARPPGSRGM